MLNNCKYFGKCGGCNLFKLQESEYLKYKYNNLCNLLSDLIDTSIIKNIIPINGPRRRVKFQVDFGNNIGFHETKTNNVVPISKCPLIEAEINNLIPKLKSLLITFVKRSEGNINITKVNNGIIINLNNINIMKLDISKINTFGKENTNIVEITATGNNLKNILSNKNINGPIVEIYKKEIPKINFNNIDIQTPSTSFLQVSNESEQKIVDTVKYCIENDFTDIKTKLNTNTKLKIADIFCGLGLFSFNLYNYSNSIISFDNDKNAISNLNKAAHKYNLPVNGIHQDLFLKPIKESVLNQLDLIIIDPPREGAINQIKQITKSSLKNLIYVSCNPITFKRDCKILLDAGYKIKTITPIDQFKLTEHIELIASFEK